MSLRISAENQALSTTNNVPNGAFTVTWWAYMTTDRVSYSTMWEPGATSGTGLYTQVGVNSSRELVAAVSSGSSPDTNFVLATGTWYCFALTQASAGGAMTLRWGTNPESLSSGAGTSPATAAATLRIGRSVWGGEWWNGRIASFKHWSAVLTPAEITEELKYWGAVRTSGLVRRHDWRSDQALSMTPQEGTASALTAGSAAATIEADPPTITDIPVVVSNPGFFLSYA